MRVEDSPQAPAYDEAAAMAAYRALGWRQRWRTRGAIYRGRAGNSVEDAAVLYTLARRRVWPLLWFGLVGAAFMGVLWGTPEPAFSGNQRLGVGLVMGVLWSGILIVKQQVVLRHAVEDNADRLHIPAEVWRAGLPTPLVIAVTCALAVAATWLGITLLPPIDLF